MIPLKVSLHDDPVILAKEFSYRHNLDPRIIGVLSKQIKQVQSKSNSNRLHSQVQSVKQSRLAYSNSRVNNSTVYDQENSAYLANAN